MRRNQRNFRASCWREYRSGRTRRRDDFQTRAPPCRSSTALRCSVTSRRRSRWRDEADGHHVAASISSRMSRHRLSLVPARPLSGARHRKRFGQGLAASARRFGARESPNFNPVSTTPAFIRLPKPKQNCPVTGLSRTGMYNLCVPCTANGFRPIVPAKCLRQPGNLRGVWLVPYPQLIGFLTSLPTPRLKASAAPARTDTRSPAARPRCKGTSRARR